MKNRLWQYSLTHILCVGLILTHSNSLYAAKKGSTVRYRGTENFIRCQDILGQDWKVVMAKPEQANAVDNWKGIYSNKTFPRVEGGENTSNFTDPERFVSYVDRESSKFAEYFTEVEQCMALAGTMTHVDLDDEDEVQSSGKGEYASFDNAIRCTTSGAETQDFPQCNVVVNLYNGMQVAKVGKDVYHQVSFAEKTGDAQTKALSNPMDPTGALKAQKTGIEAQHEIAEQNAVFESAKLAALGAAFSKMLSRKSLLETCQKSRKNAEQIRAALSEKLMKAFDAGTSNSENKVQKVQMEAISLKETIERQLEKSVKEVAQTLSTDVTNSGCATVTANVPGGDTKIQLRPFSSGLKSVNGLTATNVLGQGQLDKEGGREVMTFKKWSCPALANSYVAPQGSETLSVTTPKSKDDVCTSSYTTECKKIQAYQDEYIELAKETFNITKEKFASGFYNKNDTCDVVVNNSGFDLIKNEKAVDAIKQVMLTAGVDMAKYTGMALILNDQENKMNRAIKGVNAFKPADFSYNLSDELAALCQVNPSARECLGGGGGQVGMVSSDFTIGGNGQSTTDGKNLNGDGSGSDAAGSALSDRSNIPMGGLSTVDGGPGKGGGLADHLAAIGIEKKAAGAGGSGGGGGVGNVSAPGNNGTGAQGPQTAQGLSPSGGGGKYGGGGSGSLAYGGGGGSNARKPASNENPFADMMKGKNGGGGELNFRDPASGGVGDKGRSLFNMISTRYFVVTKDKRLEEYVEAK